MHRSGERSYYYEIRQSILILAIYIIVFEIVAGLAHHGFTLLFYKTTLHEIYMSNASVHIIELIITHALNLSIILYFFSKWLSNYHTIGPDSITLSKGVINKQSCIYGLSSIQSVSVYQNIIGRLFNVGTIKLENPMWGSDLYIKKIPNPTHHALNIERNSKNVEANGPSIVIQNKQGAKNT